MKRLLYAVCLLLILSSLTFVGAVELTSPPVASAQSSGCSSVGSLSGFISESGSRSTGAQYFSAGETISASGTLDDASAMNIQLVVTGDASTDVTSTNPSYTIPSNGNYTVSVTNVSFMDGNLSAGCTASGGGGGSSDTVNDGRLDPDPTEPFAIYCNNSALIIYQIVDGSGVETNRVPLSEVGNFRVGESRTYAQNTVLNRTAFDSMQITMTNGFKIISLTECFASAGQTLPPAPVEIQVTVATCGAWWDIPGGSYDPNCPDEDGDQVYDNIDQCLGEPSYGHISGCPDLDYDGIPDKDDLCLDTPYPLDVNGNGCDDRDGDDIPTNLDSCPDSPGLPADNGCPPATDRDGDGILNFQDWCPARNAEVEGVPDINGCPDYDLDTLAGSPRATPPDYCPHVAGTVENGGCPPVLDLFTFASMQGTYNDIIIAVEDAYCVQYSYGIYGDRYCSLFSDQ